MRLLFDHVEIENISFDNILTRIVHSLERFIKITIEIQIKEKEKKSFS